MTQKMSPYIRNAQIFSYLLVHAGGGGPVDYFTVADNVESEVRAGTFGASGLEENEHVGHVILDITSVMIRAGILGCNTFDEKRSRIVYGNKTRVWVKEHVDTALHLEPAIPVDPNEPHFYFGSAEADALYDRLGAITPVVLNDHKTPDELAFILAGDMTEDNIAAAVELSNMFNASSEVRRDITDVMMSDGGIYVDLDDADLGFKHHEPRADRT